MELNLTMSEMVDVVVIKKEEVSNSKEDPHHMMTCLLKWKKDLELKEILVLEEEQLQEITDEILYSNKFRILKLKKLE